MAEPRKKPPLYMIVPGIVLGVAAAAITSVGVMAGMAVKMAKNAVRRRAATRPRT